MIDSHTHTRYSKHAVGSVDDLVHTALARGIKIITITDHAPFFFDKENRLLESELQQYLLDIDHAKSKYDGEITILKGLEFDFVQGSYDYIIHMLDQLELDFVMGSIHYIPVGNEYVRIWDLPSLNKPDVLESYFSALHDLLQCGLFDAVGHPDALLRGVPDDVFVKHFTPVLPLFTKNDIAYELNASGLRKTTLDPISGREILGVWSYPSLSLLSQLITQEISFTIGSDAHDPVNVGEGIQEILQTLIPSGLRTISYFKNRQRIEVSAHSLCF
jgi:histidinol-phosphatase (PHP family)